MTPSRRSAAALALAGAAALSGCAHPSAHRYFQPTAEEVGPYPNSFSQAVIPHGGRIVVQGDELAYGLAAGRNRRRINGADQGQAPITISETLRRAVRGVQVDNLGYPGDTVAQSAVRWADAPPADLAILAFGFGDARAHTTQADFTIALEAYVREKQAHGATVFIVIPPALADTLRNQAVEPYRGAARIVASRTGAVVFDANAALVRLKLRNSKTYAQSPAEYQGVGADIVPYVKIVATSPQTAHSGSGDSLTVRDSPASPS